MRGKGYPTPLASVAEGARAGLRRLGVRKNQLHEGVSMSLMSLGDATHQMRRQLRRRTSFWPRAGVVGNPPLSQPPPRVHALASGDLGVRKICQNKRSAWRQHFVRECDSPIDMKGSEGHPTCAASFAEGARACLRRFGPTENSLNEGVSMYITTSVRETHRNLSLSWTDERKAPFPDPARRSSEGYGTTLFADFAS